MSRHSPRQPLLHEQHGTEDSQQTYKLRTTATHEQKQTACGAEKANKIREVMTRAEYKAAHGSRACSPLRITVRADASIGSTVGR